MVTGIGTDCLHNVLVVHDWSQFFLIVHLYYTATKEQMYILRNWLKCNVLTLIRVFTAFLLSIPQGHCYIPPLLFWLSICRYIFSSKTCLSDCLLVYQTIVYKTLLCDEKTYRYAWWGHHLCNIICNHSAAAFPVQCYDFVEKGEGEIVRIAKTNAVIWLLSVLDQLITQCYVSKSETQKKSVWRWLMLRHVIPRIDLTGSSVSLPDADCPATQQATNWASNSILKQVFDVCECWCYSWDQKPARQNCCVLDIGHKVIKICSCFALTFYDSK